MDIFTFVLAVAALGIGVTALCVAAYAVILRED